jgi:hypothetical protein
MQVTVASVADKYINAIGGKANIDKVSSYTVNASMSMQGQNIDLKMMKAKGGKELTMLQEWDRLFRSRYLTVRQDILSKWGKKWK